MKLVVIWNAFSRVSVLCSQILNAGAYVQKTTTFGYFKKQNLRNINFSSNYPSYIQNTQHTYTKIYKNSQVLDIKKLNATENTG